MRKLSVLFIVIAFISVFCSCQKERFGEYRPSMKIVRVYDESQDHYLREKWLWDGDQLSRIDFYKRNGDLDYSQKYLYDGRRLQRIETENLYSEFLYDGKKLTGIKTYSGDKLQETYSFTLKKNRLDHLSISKNSKSTSGSTLLGCFVPGFDNSATVGTPFSCSKGDDYNYTSAEVDFNWVDDDIRNVKMTITYPDKVLLRVYNYLYDEGINPKLNFFSLLVDYQLINNNPENLFCSRHNVKGMYITDSKDGVDLGTQSLFYSYEYYKKLPTKMYYNMGEDSLLIVSYLYQ